MSEHANRDIAAACKAIKAGDVVAYPTEGVFGLGCDPANEAAIEKLLSLKNRDIAKGFILIAANRRQLSPFIGELSTAIETKLNKSWPGPVTWILPCSESAAASITGGKATIATRVTAHKIASTLCREFNSAIISTSANISGNPACTSAQEVSEVFGSKLSYILDHPVGDLKGPTPIFDGLTGDQIR